MLTSISLYKSLTQHVIFDRNRREIQLQSGDRESDAGGARCPVGESEQDGSETDHTHLISAILHYGQLAYV